ncbi:MAG: sel1 repeat family protein [Rhodospirillales bacterium]|nr:sel1 repeat family protein [Rhodospirillales bacterium]
MEDMQRLNSARRLISEKKFAEGVRACQQLTDLGSAEAPDYLGILYLNGSGVPKNVAKATEYFLLSHNRGYQMGTYHLAGQYQLASKTHQALHLFKLVADTNPSAAYWAFRCLEQLEKSQKGWQDEAEQYLRQAVSLGHIEARRTSAIRAIIGYYGVSGIPGGILKFLGIAKAIKQCIEKRERLKYIDSLHRRGVRQFDEMIRRNH